MMLHDVLRTAQVALYLTYKNGGAIDPHQLTLLVYCANRQSMARYQFPITAGPLIATPNGPANETLLDGLNGRSSHQDAWNRVLQQDLEHLPENAFDELSQADQDILERVWSVFGTMTAEHIALAMQEICPEWKNPSYEGIFAALGFQEAQEMAEEIQVFEKMEALFETHA